MGTLLESLQSFPPIRSSTVQPGMYNPVQRVVLLCLREYEGMLLCHECAVWGQL